MNTNILVNNIGKTVVVRNEAHDEMDERIGFNFAGKLEQGENETEWYVRVGEDYIAGSMGVSFKLAHIQEIEKTVYGEARIILK